MAPDVWKPQAKEMLLEGLDAAARGALRSAIHALYDFVSHVCEVGHDVGIHADYSTGKAFFDYKRGVREISELLSLSEAVNEQLRELGEVREKTAHRPYAAPDVADLAKAATAVLYFAELLGVDLVGADLRVVPVMEHSSTEGSVTFVWPLTGGAVELKQYECRKLGLSMLIPRDWDYSEKDNTLRFEEDDVTIEISLWECEASVDLGRFLDEEMSTWNDNISDLRKTQVDQTQLAGSGALGVRYEFRLNKTLHRGSLTATRPLGRGQKHYIYTFDCFGQALKFWMAEPLRRAIVDSIMLLPEPPRARATVR